MFMKVLKEKKNDNPLNRTCKKSDVEFETGNKSLHYEKIVQSINFIELEKKMQSGLDLFI